ncbi:MAG: Hsp70 family protein, partial [Alphaproteobacteria bacterium]|nr:Hsp70 family protein [Alphaproteobacteria bacterium]
DDNQTAVTVHVLQGERERADANKSLGKFDLADIPPAPRGMPQVEVAFDIDANGILNVSAKDKATGKEQSIIIKASSGLSDEEIENMVKDAEAHAEDDRKFQELVNARNQADSLVHATKKSVADLGDQVTDEERQEIEAATAAVEKALEGDDVTELNETSQRLGEVSGKLAQKAYEAAQAKEGAEAGAAGDDAGPESAADDNVVDADFEEVKDEK